MVISDLQYLESVEASNLVGSGKAYGKKRKPGKYGKDVDVNIAVVTFNVTQVAIADYKSTAYNNFTAKVDIDQD
jgi:hypothetical protein